MDENVSNEKPIKNRKKLSVFFNILIITLSIIALGVAGCLIYQKRYLSPFWVNGQSMYPTLNKNAKNSSGEFYGENGSSTLPGSTFVDYGVMDKHEKAIQNLKRFDIVVCKYHENDESDKIKRIVGLPGETIKFGQGAENGKLYIKNGEEFVLSEQPIPNEYVASGNYPVSAITLGQDQFYVLGDNRAHSSDSRTNGPVKRSWMVGKVVAICAYCEIRETTVDGKVVNEPFNIRHYIPKFL